MRFPGLVRILGAVGMLAVCAAAPASGQIDQGTWRATPIFGATLYDQATPFKTAPFVGGEAHYQLHPLLRFGIGMSFARPIVDGSYYPLAIMRVHQDTTMLVQVGQQVTQVNYAGLATVGTLLGPAFVYGQAGLGGYTFFLDRAVNYSIEKRGHPSRVSGMLVPLGIGFAVGQAAAVRLEVRDEIFFGLDRELFNPVEPRFRNECTPGQHVQEFCFEEANRIPPAARETNHNIKLILGFELVPGRR
jgi:hypothetical protein